MKTTIILGVLSFILGAVLPYLKDYVKKTPNKVDDIALDIVIKVNEMFNGDSGESKKQRAKDLLTLALKEKGQSIGSDVLDKTVEMAVTKMKVAEVNNKQLENVGVDNAVK